MANVFGREYGSVCKLQEPFREPCNQKKIPAVIFRQFLRTNEVQADIIKRKGVIGIIAKVCTYLAENGINILDISQTIVQDYFNMMMIVDTSTMAKPFGDMVDEMTALGEETGVQIKCQKEEIFDKMHRI